MDEIRVNSLTSNVEKFPFFLKKKRDCEPLALVECNKKNDC